MKLLPMSPVRLLPMSPVHTKGRLGGFYSRIRLSPRQKTLISESPPMGAPPFGLARRPKPPAMPEDFLLR